MGLSRPSSGTPCRVIVVYALLPCGSRRFQVLVLGIPSRYVLLLTTPSAGFLMTHSSDRVRGIRGAGGPDRKHPAGTCHVMLKMVWTDTRRWRTRRELGGGVGGRGWTMDITRKAVTRVGLFVLGTYGGCKILRRRTGQSEVVRAGADVDWVVHTRYNYGGSRLRVESGGRPGGVLHPEGEWSLGRGGEGRTALGV